MQLVEFTENFIDEVSAFLEIPIIISGQNLDTTEITEWGTIQQIYLKYDDVNIKRTTTTRTTGFNVIFQFNFNVKFKSELRNALRYSEIMSKFVSYIKSHYHFSPNFNTKIYKVRNHSSIRDLTSTSEQVTIYSKSIDIEIRGYEEYSFNRVPIDSVSGTVKDVVNSEEHEFKIEKGG